MTYTQAGNKAAQKYVKLHRDRVNITVRKGLRGHWQAAAEAVGQSLTAYIMQAIAERMQRDGFQPPAAGAEEDTAEEGAEENS